MSSSLREISVLGSGWTPWPESRDQQQRTAGIKAHMRPFLGRTVLSCIPNHNVNRMDVRFCSLIAFDVARATERYRAVEAPCFEQEATE